MASRVSRFLLENLSRRQLDFQALSPGSVARRSGGGVAGLWMGIAGLITGAQWALDVDGSVWLGIGRWLVVAVGLAGAGYGLFASVRWVAGLVETWKGRGMPKWPRRRR